MGSLLLIALGLVVGWFIPAPAFVMNLKEKILAKFKK